MSSPLFQFELRALSQIQPWGAPEDPNLHWFGLTDGHYWIQVGEHKLFEYSQTAQAKLGGPRFCDYQVVRLYEDVIDLAPYALEQVPEVLKKYIALDESKPWNYYRNKWCGVVDSSDPPEDELHLLDDALSWIGRRMLDSAYLAPSANIVFWGDQDHVHVEWDNRGKTIQDCRAWSAQFGSWQLTRSEFISEVRSFHDRLMAQMQTRIAEVAAGALASKVRCDLEALRWEQLVRSKSIEGNLGQPSPPTDWQSVIAAVTALEARVV